MTKFSLIVNLVTIFAPGTFVFFMVQWGFRRYRKGIIEVRFFDAASMKLVAIVGKKEDIAETTQILLKGGFARQEKPDEPQRPS